jgi:outer membrane protein assembly factor BamB
VAEAAAVALDGAGDVVAAGALTNAGTLSDFAVVKFDGASGAEQWRHSINGLSNGHEEARTVAVTAAGDVIAAGAITNDWNRDFAIVKFAGASGAELWRRDDFGVGSSGIDFASAVALDAAGDVFAAGFLERTEPAGFTVLKVDGGSGGDRWRQVLTGNGFSNMANGIAVDASGDVVAAGGIATTDREGDFTVVKFEGASGSERWRQQLNGSSPHVNRATAVGVDAAGDVFAAGSLTNAESNSDFTVIKLAAANGTERWRRVLNGTANGFDSANVVAGRCRR